MEVHSPRALPFPTAHVVYRCFATFLQFLNSLLSAVTAVQTSVEDVNKCLHTSVGRRHTYVTEATTTEKIKMTPNFPSSPVEVSISHNTLVTAHCLTAFSQRLLLFGIITNLLS